MREKALRTLSVTYLLLPNLIFYYSWVNVPVAIAGLLILLYLAKEEWFDQSYKSIRVLAAKDFIVLGAATFVLTVISGINGYVFQNIDYWAHNTKFYELLTLPWPIRIPQDGPLVAYYYGFYIIPAFLSQLTGSVNELFIFLWTWLGLLWAMAWVYLALNRKIIFTLLVLCIGDLPYVLKSFLSLFSIRLYDYGTFGIESWSNFENLLWVPNQFIPAVLIGGMFVYSLTRGIHLDTLVLPIALSFWWAVFPSFIGGLFVGGLIVHEWFLKGFKLDWLRVTNKVILPFLICVPVLLFFLSNDGKVVSGFLWQFDLDLANTGLEYIVNIGINAMLFLLAYFWFKNMQLPFLAQLPFYFLILLELLLPIYRLGEVNDLLFRGMMPLLIIAGIYMFYPLTVFSWDKTWAIVRTSRFGIFLLILLMSSSLFGISRLVRAGKVNRFTEMNEAGNASFKPIPYDAYDNVYELLQDRWSQEAAEQYMGSKDSFYDKYLAP